jgi:hypothetical protein
VRAREDTGGMPGKWVVPCTHPDLISTGKIYDFSILATGASDAPPIAAVRHSWKGDSLVGRSCCAIYGLR